MACKTVLIIEDELVVREAMRDVLELQGYEVILAADGAEALALLKNKSKLPCVILLDLMMPHMNGWDFLDFQRTDKELSQIPIVICSAYKESAAAIKPSGLLDKPIQRACSYKQFRISAHERRNSGQSFNRR